MNGAPLFIAPRVGRSWTLAQWLAQPMPQIGLNFVLTHALDDLFNPTPLIFRGHHE